MIQLYDDRCVQVEPNTGRFIGATNTFPDGKVSGDDEGELRIAIANDGKLIMMKFGKSVDWIGFGPQEAVAVATNLLKHVRECGS